MNQEVQETINKLNEWLKDNNYKDEVRLLNNWNIVVDFDEISDLFKKHYQELENVENIPYRSGMMSILNDYGFIKVVISK